MGFSLPTMRYWRTESYMGVVGSTESSRGQQLCLEDISLLHILHPPALRFCLLPLPRWSLSLGGVLQLFKSNSLYSSWFFHFGHKPVMWIDVGPLVHCVASICLPVVYTNMWCEWWWFHDDFTLMDCSLPNFFFSINPICCSSLCFHINFKISLSSFRKGPTGMFIDSIYQIIYERVK